MRRPFEDAVVQIEAVDVDDCFHWQKKQKPARRPASRPDPERTGGVVTRIIGVSKAFFNGRREKGKTKSFHKVRFRSTLGEKLYSPHGQSRFAARALRIAHIGFFVNGSGEKQVGPLRREQRSRGWI